MVSIFNTLELVYKGKKVLLTGHTGFKGSWLLKLLVMLGADVKGYALPPEDKNGLYNLINGNSICNSVIADIRDKEKIKTAIISYKPDFIFHLAAQPLVRLSYAIPVETFEVNAIGTANVLEGIKNLEEPCCSVFITTDKVYYNNEWTYPYRENDRLGGYDPYSASKACTELIIDSYRNSFFSVSSYEDHRKAIAVGRAGNVIGGGDWSKDRLIPDIVKALSKKEEIIVRNPSAVRPWQHVLEPIIGYLLLGCKLVEAPQQFSQAYNFGPYFSDALPVENMVKLAIENWGSGNYMIQQNGNQLHEAGLLKLDISKAISDLKWVPKIDAAKAVKTTISWYKKFFEMPTEILAYTEEQIHEFIK